jgi:hypothetical protein
MLDLEMGRLELVQKSIGVWVGESDEEEDLE